MRNIGIYGLGPVAMLVAKMLELAEVNYFFIARRSKRGYRLKELLPSDGIEVRAIEQRADLLIWNGRIKKREVYFLDEITFDIENLFLCSPHSSFASILKSLAHIKIQNIILANSGLGRTLEVSGLLASSSLTCFSNFFGAAKYLDHDDTIVSLKNIKKEVCIYTNSKLIGCMFEEVFNKTNISVTFAKTIIEAEFKNITLYAHPAFSISPVCLSYSLGVTDIKKYMYKTFPEGPIEPRVTYVYASLARLIQQILAKLGAEKFNVLSFLHDKNYKVLDCYLSKEEVDSYPSLNLIEQGKLIFARYIGLLVDPESVPDEQGRYFDFSAVPMPLVHYRESHADLPRILREDLYHIHVLYYLAEKLDLKNGVIKKLFKGLNEIVEELETKRQAMIKSEIHNIKIIAIKNAQLILKTKVV